ncbi:MAG TPA: nucleoside monophosphate kinase, partial [Candidatus Binataceae bacterium]|nr:nucleoside monophosphate kinase [Candidatus Binataceae bacterium]
MRLALLGPPGVGKGTQARALGALWGVPQVASGDLLRAAIQEGTEIGRLARPLMENGHLVPDDIVLKLIKERLGRVDARRGFILDGYPR